MALRTLEMDLHVHSCLSPCGDLTMIPSAIVRRALAEKLDVIGLADHNTAENVAAVQDVAKANALVVLGGMEICSREEIHLLAFIDGRENLLALQAWIYAALQGSNDRKAFGEQVVVDSRDEIVELNDRLLIGATDLPVKEIVERVHRLGGIVIASHIDRDAFSIVGQLGFIPKDLHLDAVELSRNAGAQSPAAGYPLVRSSDAHYLHDIGTARTRFLVAEPTVAELKLAFRGQEGRKVL